MSTLNDSDLFLVDRGGTSYKETYANVKTGLNPSRPPVITSVTLAEDNALPGSDRFTDQGFTSTVVMGDVVILLLRPELNVL